MLEILCLPTSDGATTIQLFSLLSSLLLVSHALSSLVLVLSSLPDLAVDVIVVDDENRESTALEGELWCSDKLCQSFNRGSCFNEILNTWPHGRKRECKMKLGRPGLAPPDLLC